MCSARADRAEDDRTARAIIRDEALRLFAAHGADAVTVRQIAAAAGVSPALVVHHFGTKEALRDMVDQHVLDLFDRMLGETVIDPDIYDPAHTESLTGAILRHLPVDSPVPGYLSRLLTTGGLAGQRLFARIYHLSLGALDAMAAAGMADRGDDPAVRAAFLMVNDLAVLLLRDRLTDVLGVDPISPEGMTRWVGEVLRIYSNGLGPGTPPAPGTSAAITAASDPRAANPPAPDSPAVDRATAEGEEES